MKKRAVRQGRPVFLVEERQSRGLHPRANSKEDCAMSINPTQPGTQAPSSDVNLEQLADEIRLDCVAVEEAGRCALDRAITAGKRLLKVRECIGRGLRQWLQQHGLSKTVCYDFILLARNEESVRSPGHSSVAAALRMLRAKSSRKASKPKAKSLLTKALWIAAGIEERRRFLDSIGVNSFCEAFSPPFRAELRRRVGGQRAAMTSALGETVAAAFRQVLSLQKSAKLKDTPAMGVAAALNAVNNKLGAAGLDLNNITAVNIDATATRRQAA
jgi:hypothetical protein